MAKTNRRDIQLSPLFGVPPGVIDVRQENTDESSDSYEGITTVQPQDGPVLSSPNDTIPNAPTNFTVVSQTIRTAPDGSSVVDVLFEFSDINNTTIDINVSPA